MIDQPAAPDLLDAMANALRDVVMPACEGAPKHAARVVANLCEVLAREFVSGNAAAVSTAAELAQLLGAGGDLESLVAELDRRLASVNPDLSRETFELLERNVERRLAIAKPDYL